MTTANPYAVAGGAVAVTATSTGQLTPPAPAGQGGYNFATVSNASPWFCTVVGAAGTSTLQPFTADVIPVSLGQLLSYTMSIPPGGSGTTISAQPTYIQADWFAAGNAPPVGTYPINLTAQAILASVAGPTSANTGVQGTFTQTGLAVLFGPTTALTLRWITLSTTILSATTTGGAIVFATVAVPGGNQILSMMLPVPVTFVPVAETITLELGPGGMAMPANAGGVFGLSVNIYSGAASAMAGAVVASAGF